MNHSKFVLLCLTAAAAVQMHAAVIPIAGGSTQVDFDPAVVAVLTGAGLTIAPLGTASIAGTVAAFPITGGTVGTDTNTAVLYHDGSGLRFASASATLDLMNFIIGATVTPGSESGVLTGDVMGAITAPGVPLFDIGPGLQLALTGAAAGALSTAFGLPDLTGTVVGTASASPEPVPEPATMLVAAGGLAAIALRRGLGTAGR
jgi:hypothetical protein